MDMPKIPVKFMMRRKSVQINSKIAQLRLNTKLRLTG